VSVKRLNGWEPREVTEHEYDDAGRCVRSVTTREVEWDEDERAWALALLELEADACPGCHGRMSETTAPEAEGKYVSPAPTRCHMCTAISAAQSTYHDNPNVRHTSALLWSAERR
jgi:hypothetical protein